MSALGVPLAASPSLAALRRCPLVPLAAVGASALVIGIGDQKPDMFSDPLSRSSASARADRRLVGRAAARVGARRSSTRWLDAARAAGVAAAASASATRARRPPARAADAVERFKYDFRLFRARYPWVTTFATWNEANHCGEPTCHRPAAGRRLLPRDEPGVPALHDPRAPRCSTCPTWPRGSTSSRSASARAVAALLGPAQLHRRQPDAHDRHAHAAAPHQGQIWFTETGGIVGRRNRSQGRLPGVAARTPRPPPAGSSTSSSR